MILKSIVASCALIAFTTTSSFAQQAASKYDNDLDRAMCVFSKAHRNYKLLVTSVVGASVVGSVGTIFAGWRSSKFSTSATEIANALASKLFESPAQRDAIASIMASEHYFTNTVTGKKIGKEFQSVLEVFKNIPDEQIQDYVTSLKEDASWMSKKQQEIKALKIPTAGNDRYNNISNQITSLEGELYQSPKRINAIKAATILDQWTASEANKEILQQVVEQKIGAISENFVLKSGLTKESLAELQTKLSLKGNRAGLVALIAGIITVSIIGNGGLAIIDASKVSEILHWDIVDVRNYISKPEHSQELENLANQAPNYGCY